MKLTTLIEVKYYKDTRHLDWQEDIDEHGSMVGVCPKCRGEGRTHFEGDSLATAKAWWECQNCGHASPKEHAY